MPKTLFEAQNDAGSFSVPQMPVAHPSKEQRRQWNSDYLGAPVAKPKNSDLQDDLTDSTSYSLLDYLTYNATDRNQQDCGNGWVWAGTGALEVAHATQNGNYDRLSIQYLNSKYDNGGRSPYAASDCACNGGTSSDFVGFYKLMGKYGGNKTVIPWSNDYASFQDGNVSSGKHSNVESSLLNLTPSYKLESLAVSRVDTWQAPQNIAIDNIKRMLDSGKPVILSYYLPDQNAWTQFETFWNYGLEDESYFDLDTFKGSTYTSSGGSHTVLVTGYNDNGTAGYWQCLNSVGTSAFRPNGIFYINAYMDYSAAYSDAGENLPVTQWETLDVIYNTTSTNISTNSTENPNLNASFEVSPESGYAPLTVHFSDLSEGSPDSWKWNFGDGGESILSNPNHTYVKPGHYSVSLEIKKSGYTGVTHQKDVVTVKYPYVKVNPFPKPEGGNYSVPTDPIGDGRYADINGNGWLENDDPVVLLKNLQYAQKNEPVVQFDFDGSGFIGYGDLVMVKKMV
ncbi:MAG: PKD domain-containing protein [Methanospirillum sp.]|uniref:PKD domain-containing protein n=1 Tax=Methanospirillum sp. TaxID=45200 RepID=UPI00236C2812|nr:PKD domain-containing protein [Methanospirillum sp.]MDD1730315.1 PKD domain-containing protein [Methanospirillum sp.]